MKQQTLAMAADQAAGFEQHRKPTRRGDFLVSLNRLIPWEDLCAVIDRTILNAVTVACQLAWSECCVFISFNTGLTWQTLPVRRRCMTAPACGGLWASIWDASRFQMRPPAQVSPFAGEASVGRAPVCRSGPSAARRGMNIKTGTIVDSTIIGAPSSTKNREKQRDPEMHQTKKGRQWCFGMKLHIGVDTKAARRTVRW